MIRAAYAADLVDEMICGDIEDVEIDLGLRIGRSTPARRYWGPSQPQLPPATLATLKPTAPIYRKDKSKIYRQKGKQKMAEKSRKQNRKK